jgi:hypothetical protein
LLQFALIFVVADSLARSRRLQRGRDRGEFMS